jgi:hypothetical protein
MKEHFLALEEFGEKVQVLLSQNWYFEWLLTLKPLSALACCILLPSFEWKIHLQNGNSFDSIGHPSTSCLTNLMGFPAQIESKHPATTRTRRRSSAFSATLSQLQVLKI